jgi:trehalose-6-phosphatase
MKKIVRFGGITLTAVAFFFGHSCLTRSASPPELKLLAQLVWGTNSDKLNDPKLKEVEGSVVEKLRKVFKWNNYFEVSRQTFTALAGTPRKIRMSDRCEIEVQNLGNSSIEVKLYGKGKLTVRKTQRINPSELLVLAGDDKNDTAWFVVLSQAEK